MDPRLLSRVWGEVDRPTHPPPPHPPQDVQQANPQRFNSGLASHMRELAGGEPFSLPSEDRLSSYEGSWHRVRKTRAGLGLRVRVARAAPLDNLRARRGAASAVG
jgi:hypothetical protein